MLERVVHRPVCCGPGKILWCHERLKVDQQPCAQEFSLSDIGCPGPKIRVLYSMKSNLWVLSAVD